MGHQIQITAIILFSVLINTSLFAQTKEWKIEKTDDGSVEVKSCISEHKTSTGNTLPLIEYTATTIVRTDIQKCISLMKDIPKHKAFLRDAKESKMVTSLAVNQWIVYYNFNAPWPFSDYDCVTKMELMENDKNSTAIFTLVAAPSLYKKTDEDRLTDYKISYQFKKLADGKVAITIIGRMSPLIKIPLWMLRGTMPDHPAEVLHKIVTLVSKM